MKLKVQKEKLKVQNSMNFDVGASLVSAHGITLISLVITIIILIILAGVTINLTVGENGIFSKARQAKENMQIATNEEEEKLAILANELNSGEFANNGLPENTPENPQPVGKEVALKEGWGTEAVNYINTSNGEKVTSLTKVSTVYAVSVGNGETVPVPKGFYYVGGNLDTGVVISDKEEDKYEEGKDKTTHAYATQLIGNQFVWIPCSIGDYKKIDFGKENAKWDMETNAAEYNQIEKYRGFYIGRYEAGVSTLNELTNTFENSVTFSGGASLYNAVAIQTGLHSWGWQNYNFTARQEGTVVPTGSNKVESGNVVVKANSIPYYHSDYYTAVEMSRKLYNNNSYVQSGLTTGTQWDMIMKYMQNKGIDITTSNWGNYDDVKLENLRGYYTNVTTAGATDGFKSCSGLTNTNSGTSSYVLLTTGSTEQVKKLNLYDIAGNLWEWTTEASYIDGVDYNNDSTYNSYMLRGGSFGDAHATRPACYRVYSYAPDTRTNYGFRVALYIK